MGVKAYLFSEQDLIHRVRMYNTDPLKQGLFFDTLVTLRMGIVDYIYNTLTYYVTHYEPTDQQSYSDNGYNVIDQFKPFYNSIIKGGIDVRYYNKENHPDGVGILEQSEEAYAADELYQLIGSLHMYEGSDSKSRNSERIFIHLDMFMEITDTLVSSLESVFNQNHRQHDLVHVVFAVHQHHLLVLVA